VHGSQVQLEVKAPVSLSVDAELEVPSPISLEVHMTGGDLTVEGVDGDKNLQLLAGDLKVDVGTLQKVGTAEVSVRVGDVDVPPSDRSADGWATLGGIKATASIDSTPTQALATLAFSPSDS
jgi:hypothetical protein